VKFFVLVNDGRRTLLKGGAGNRLWHWPPTTRTLEELFSAKFSPKR